MNPMSMEGLNILITGSGRGVGKEVAKQVVDLGGRVILNDIDADVAHQAAEEIGQPDAPVFAGSVADPGFVEEMVNGSVAKLGAIHGLVNNAGIVRAAMAHKMSQKVWQEVIDVNLTGVYQCLQAVGRHMIERRKDGDKDPGRIVNISSIAGRRGTIGQINYGAAKAGVLGLTMSAAKEWGRHDICVNSVCFGVVETRLTETIRSDKFREQYEAQVVLNRFALPEEVAVPVVFLLGHGSSYITGQHISVDGGAHIGF